MSLKKIHGLSRADFQSDDPVNWVVSAKGKFSLALLAVSLICYYIVIQ